LKLVFAGTPEFARYSLQALIEAAPRLQFSISAVFTQPDRPAGRGQQLQASPVKMLAQAHQIPVEQPASLKTIDAQALLRAYPCDLMIVAAYGLLLPQIVLDMPRLGCINVHGSVLPRWRGAAPIVRAIEAGDTQTGICIMAMEAGLDTGPVYSTTLCPIEPQDSASSLHDKLAILGGQALVDSLPGIFAGQLKAVAQPEHGITYAHKILKSEANIDWTQSAIQLANRIRAFDPFPGATTVWNGQLLKCWAANALSVHPNPNAAPGTVVQLAADFFVVATGSGALAITSAQLPGAKRLSGAAMINALKQKSFASPVLLEANAN
jgi:methionyl-tRNA formyltransferase